MEKDKIIGIVAVVGIFGSIIGIIGGMAIQSTQFMLGGLAIWGLSLGTILSAMILDY